MIIELHLLQSFPVSNLNRDDVGQPKTATFGGQPRGRISSQALKYAVRQLFGHHGLEAAETGVRTRRLVHTAVEALEAKGRPTTESVAVAEAALRAFGFGFSANKPQSTEYLLFVGKAAADLLADYCNQDWDRLLADATASAAVAAKRKKDAANQPEGGTATEKQQKAKPDKPTLETARRVLDATRVADVALFGRMVADNRDFNVDAASQVAHALSTHAVVNEYDYYTAVDDLNPDDASGAGMIGTVDFNAACYYRYANLDLDQLARNLQGDNGLVPRAARAWLNAFIDAIPSGKQNSMAALTPPETLLTVVRDRGGWNLANAFLKPVTDADLMTASTRKLMDHFGSLRQFYGEAEIRAVVGASATAELTGLPDGEVARTRDELVARALAAAEV